MDFELIKACLENKETIKNLLQFYIYDFSEFLNLDVEDDGLFGAYPYLEDYWKDGTNRFPYLVKKDGKYAGFVLVRFIQSPQRNYFSIAEFFILRKYRRTGIGTAVARRIFDLHRGHWEVWQKESNRPARLFWKKVISSYTNGRFIEHSENGRVVQDFEN